MPLPRPVRNAVFLLAAPFTLASVVRADPIRLVAADDRGVTLELAFPDYALGPAGEDGRSPLTVPGLAAHALPGRPVLPSATTLLAVPPGARPVIGTLEGGGEETREGVRLVPRERDDEEQPEQDRGNLPETRIAS